MVFYLVMVLQGCSGRDVEAVRYAPRMQWSGGCCTRWVA